MMRVIQYLIPFWIGTMLYVFLSVCAGPMGVSAYRQTLAERTRLQTNLDSLRRINDDLTAKKRSLLYDGGTVAVYARELGYAREDERVIRIEGVPGMVKQPVDPGVVLIATPPQSLSNRTIRIFSIGMSAILLICVFVRDMSHTRRPTPRFRPASRVSAARPGRAATAARVPSHKPVFFRSVKGTVIIHH